MIQSKVAKFIMLILGLLGSYLYPFSLSSLTPFAFAERIHRRAFGVDDASPYYQEKISEFLTYIDVDHGDVKIRKLELSTDVLQANVSSSGFIGISLWTGIWVNELKLEAMEQEEKLWTLALLAAQYKLNRSFANVVWAQVLPWTAGLVNVAGILMILPFLHMCSSPEGKAMLAALVGLVGARLSLMLYSSFVQRWYAYHKWSENEANLMAARLLCEHGYVNACEIHVQNSAASHKENYASNESNEKLAEYLNKWHEEH